MPKQHVLICGSGADRIRMRLLKDLGPSAHLSVVPDPLDLVAVELVPPPSLVLACADLATDAVFSSWRSSFSTQFPLVWVTGPGAEAPAAREGRGGTTIPEAELGAIPYLLDLTSVGSPEVREIPETPGSPTEKRRKPIVGQSPGIRGVIASARKVLDVNSSVLILGESGTGKELVASMIHHEGKRSSAPFIRVNCAAIPETLLESELFGIEQNIATDVDRRIGKFELADGGTIFLDEIGDMSLLTQAKVLRILQEKEFERVGGGAPIRINARVIAATNKDLPREIEAGRFRSDLYYRLNVINIRIPPLRERREDIVDLVRHFVEIYSRENSLQPKKVAFDVLDLVRSYSWPGNVRELENAVERAVVLGEGDTIRRCDLPPQILTYLEIPIESSDPPDTFHRRVSEFERSILVEELDRSGWVQARAARRLGISERSMWHLFKKYRLDRIPGSRKQKRRGLRALPDEKP